MSGDQAPDHRSSEVAPIGNNNQLTATNSQVGAVVQVSGSPGAVVNQVHIEQSSAVNGILAGMFGVVLLVFVAVLPLLGKVLPNGFAVLIVGLSSALIVGGFFSWVEGLLKNPTKSDIAGWLVGVEVGKKVEPWPETFVKVFDRVFGTRHLSWKCLWRSILASLAVVVTAAMMTFPTTEQNLDFVRGDDGRLLLVIMFSNVVPDYLSLLETRYVLTLMRKTSRMSLWSLYLLVDLLVTGITAIVMASVTITLWDTSDSGFPFEGEWLAWVVQFVRDDDHFVRNLFLYPALFTSGWLWLYAASGFLLKVVHRFDLGFQWFNSKFDVEKRPLSAIGVVAGVLMALVYWTVAIASRFVGA